MVLSYDHKKTEAKWRKKWEEVGLFQNLYFGEDAKKVTSKNKYYILPQLPYPSGDGLHMGHSEVYSACDIYARYQRMQGKEVLQVMGWDSFGLPAENYAIKTNVHPKINTNKAIDNYREQIKSLGVSVDWEREVGSHNPDYYKFTQWFFLLMYERGLAYRKMGPVNWCESCKTVLANEQVEDGKCERCDTKIERKEMEQWFLKITDYADRLIDDLDKVDWPKETIKRQRDWIGRKEGINITYEVEGSKATVTCFTTTPVNFGASFIVVAPEYPYLKDIITAEQRSAVTAYVKKAFVKSDLERQEGVKNKTGVFSGSYAINHLNSKKLPIYIADFVLGHVGTGAVQGCPGHDKRDFEFAEKYKLPIIRVVEGRNGETSESIDSPDEVKINTGVTRPMVNSDFLNGISFDEAMQKTMDYFEKKGWGKRVVEYKLHDWNVSRQRFWGAPVPMVYDEKGETHPVKNDDLPVLLPDDVDFKPTGQSPLTYSDNFQRGVEEKYGKGWRREVDTLDTFMCSSWYFFRYLDPKNDKEFASKESLKRWMPVDFYLGGPEHVNGHLLYSRFFTKVLFDAGYIDFDEPFLVHRHQGMIWGEDNRKMGKRWGNVINPSDVVNEYGGDTARMYMMFMGPLTADKPWDTNGVVGIRKFIARVYRVAINNLETEVKDTSIELRKLLNKTVKKVGEDVENLKFNTAIAAMMKFVNAWERDSKGLSKDDLEKFIKILAPFGPFVSEDLYQLLINRSKKVYKKDKKSSQKVPDNFTSVHVQSWPEYDETLAKDKTVTIIVQVNGKIRSTLEDIFVKASEDGVKKQARKAVRHHLKGKKIINEIYVPQRIINFVTN